MIAHLDHHAHVSGLPAALPPASVNDGLLPPVDAPNGRNTGRKLEHPVIRSRVRPPARAAVAVRARTPGARRTTTGRGPGRIGLLDLRASLSPRDLLVLTLANDHKFLKTRQLQALAFTNHASGLSAARSARRVLQRLDRDRLLTALPRRVGGMFGGADDSIWHLTPTGYRLLQLASGDADEGLPLRIREPSERTIKHCLAVVDARIAIEQTARESGELVVARVITEPGCWRTYTGPLGTTEILKPDLELVTRTADDHGQYEDRWFMEIDLSTEHPPTVVRQCQQYETYRRTGQEQERIGVFPLVVWVVRTTGRVERLSRAVRAAHRLDSELFRVITCEQLPRLVSSGEGGEI